MAKKFVRGITDVKTINNQDFDTNNVNDLLSDGQYNYIHRKKGKTEEYHNLTDNIKTLSSDNTDLLSVTNNNKTTNTATLHPKHDAQKEQLLESTRNTIAINHGTNGTAEKTTVDTNPAKVLEHENLTVGDGLIKEHTGNTTDIRISRTKVLFNDSLTGGTGITVYNDPSWWGPKISLTDEFIGTVNGKQDTLTAGSGITIQGNTISATAPVEGASLSIQRLDNPTDSFIAIKHDVTSGQQKLTTFVFQCREAESVLTGELKEKLKKFVKANMTVSNGAVSISYDATTMKLTNSAPSNNVRQQGTFTFYEETAGGGGGSV